MEKIEVTDELALKLFKDHRRNVQKFPTPPKKLLLSENKLEENEQISSLLVSLEDILSTERVERRCARSKANWSNERRLAVVTKINGTLLAHFGYQDRTGVFLHPEEALLLLEINRLELFWNEVPMSIQQAYNLVIDDTYVTLAKYSAYKKLVLQGLTVVKAKNTGDENTKRSSDVSETVQPSKKVRCENTNDENDTEAFLKKIKLEGPTMNRINKRLSVDYKVQVPNSGQKEVNLSICSNETVPCYLGWSETAHNDIVAVSNNSTLRYYQFASVELPKL